jgi:hypothetical protein
MEGLTPSETRQFKRIVWAILAVGFTAAIAVHFVNRARPENPLQGQLESKKYLHDLEIYGGQANVLAAEFREWFSGLWYGENLAYTIAALTLLSVGAVRLVFALKMPPDEESEACDGVTCAHPPEGHAASDNLLRWKANKK